MNEGLFRLLEYEIEPYLEYDEFNSLIILLKDYFDETNLDYCNCKECHERCSRQVIRFENELYISCPSGYLDKPKKIKSEELINYKFNVKKFLKDLSLKNGISYFYRNDDKQNNLIFFGEKEINKINHKFFYVNRLFSQNSIDETALYSVKSWQEQTERAIIITPHKFILDKKTKNFIQNNTCELFSLPELIKNDLLIDKIGTSTREDIERLIKAFELIIINPSEVYLFGSKISIEPMPFKLLEVIAIHRKKGLNCSFDTCIDYLWGEETIKNVDFPKQLNNHRSAINKACEKTGIEAEIYKNFIKAENKTYELKISPEKIYIPRY